MGVQQPVHYETRRIGRNGKADANEATLFDRVVECGIHPDNLPVNVHERTAGITVVDGRVYLKVVVKRRVLKVAIERTDDSTRHRRAKPQRVPDRKYMIAYPQAAAITPLQSRKRAIELNFDDSKVHHRCDGNQLSTGPFPGVKDDSNVHGVVGDVFVGDDDARRIDNEAGAMRFYPPRLAPSRGRWP